MNDPPFAVTKITASWSTSVPRAVRMNSELETKDRIGWYLHDDGETKVWGIRALDAIDELGERPLADTKITKNNATSVPKPVRRQTTLDTGDYLGWYIYFDDDGRRWWIIKKMPEDEAIAYQEKVK